MFSVDPSAFACSTFLTSAARIRDRFRARVESRSRHVVQSLVSLARGIGLDAIAEGVNSPGQLEMLRGMECTYGQGFFFSKPVARDELATLLRRDCKW